MSKPCKAILSNPVRVVTLVPLVADQRDRAAMLAIEDYTRHGSALHAALTTLECAELAVSLLEAYAYNRLDPDAVPQVRKLLSPLLGGG